MDGNMRLLKRLQEWYNNKWKEFHRKQDEEQRRRLERHWVEIYPPKWLVEKSEHWYYNNFVQPDTVKHFKGNNWIYKVWFGMDGWIYWRRLRYGKIPHKSDIYKWVKSGGRKCWFVHED